MKSGIGLPGVYKTKKVYRSSTVNGYKVKTCNVSWCGNFIGFDVWVNGEKFYKGVLTRDEAVTSAIASYKRSHV